MSYKPLNRPRRGGLVLFALLLATQGFSLSSTPVATSSSRPERVVHVDPVDAFPETMRATARATAASSTPACSGSHPQGYEMLYARPSDVTSRFTALQSFFLSDAAAAADRMVAESSAAPVRPRFFCGITEVAMTRPAAGYLATPFDTIAADLDARGKNATNKKYLVWWDGHPEPGTCGIGSYYKDDRPDPSVNFNNEGPDYAVIFTKDNNEFCGWNIVLHEMMHTLGSVLENAPNATPNAHCTDGTDIMCYADAPGVIVNPICPGDYEYLDCNKDDYFNPAPGLGSYLDTHWNTYDSSFLEAAGSPPPAPGTPDTSITSKPASYSKLTSATFAFASTVGGSTFDCIIDGGAAQACTSPVNYPGLSQGSHTFSVAATANALTDGTPASYTWTIDNVVPTVNLIKPSTILGASKTVPIAWSASDATTLSHQIWYRQASTSAGFGGYSLLRTQAGTSFNYTGSPGRTYCFKVKTSDAAGNYSWSLERCASVPLDDWSGSVSNIGRSTGSSFYNGTISIGRRSGGRLTFSNIRAKTLTAGLQMCSSCRYVDVYWNGVRIKQMNLYSAQAKWVQVTLRSASSIQTGKLEFVVRSPVIVIDYVGASQV